MTTVDVTQENFEQVVGGHDIVTVDFWAPRCGPCRGFAPVYEAASEKYPDVVFASAAVPATAPGDVQDAQVPRETGMSEAAVALGGGSRRRSTSPIPGVVPPPSLASPDAALPLPSTDGVMPREGLDGPERPPSLESKVSTEQEHAPAGCSDVHGRTSVA